MANAQFSIVTVKKLQCQRTVGSCLWVFSVGKSVTSESLLKSHLKKLSLSNRCLLRDGTHMRGFWTFSAIKKLWILGISMMQNHWHPGLRYCSDVTAGRHEWAISTDGLPCDRISPHFPAVQWMGWFFTFCGVYAAYSMISTNFFWQIQVPLPWRYWPRRSGP